MKRQLIRRVLPLLLLILGVSIPTEAAKQDQKTASEPVRTEVETPQMSYTDQVLNSFVGYYNKGIDEKLYLQTDKPYYSAGEHIWFKGYLLNAITHAPLKISNFIYVELSDSEGSLISRVKVIRDANGFNGHITMEPTLEAGDYTLRGYTKWMMNKENGFLFTKNIKIVSPISERAKPTIDPNDKAAVRAVEREEERANKAAAEEAEQRASEEVKVLKYDVQFFPEGGALLANKSQIIALKALAEDGLSTEVKGNIVNSKGKIVTEVESSYKGMGLFQFFAEAGESYTAEMESEDGLKMSFPLPTVETTGVAIKVSTIGPKIYYQVTTTDPNLLIGSHIVIHSRGQIITVAEAKEVPTSLPTKLLNSGISTFSVVDPNNQVVSERLVFNYPDSLPTLNFKCSAENFQPRQLATFRVGVTDTNGKPAKGEFAVSVTDNATVVSDPAKDNILSYLLLSSDIRGHIEDPGLYFTDNSAKNRYQLDLLMRTQAWRRFDLSEVLRNDVPKSRYLYEDKATISGSVKGFFGNEARRPRIAVLCSQLNYADLFDLDESSNFRLIGLNIPDSTTYIIRAMGRNGGGSLTLNIDPEEYPQRSESILTRIEQTSEPPIAFVNQSKDKFFYEGGMQTIALESIEVTTSATESAKSGYTATNTTSRKDLEALSGLSLESLLLQMPSITIGRDEEEGITSVFYRGGPTPARFVVNGMDEMFENLRTLTSNDIEQLDFFSGADAAMFSDASGGVFSITLREGASTSSTVTPPNIAFVSQLGYQTPAKFFQPAYEVASVKRNYPPDYRSTIYWDGSIKPDSYGNINFGFYTADKATSYTVTIEGITEDGEICRGTTTIERTQSTF